MGSLGKLYEHNLNCSLRSDFMKNENILKASVRALSRLQQFIK